MVGMMRASCQDLAGTGIHTACICPGFTNTEMLRAHVGESEETLQAIGGLSTFGRLIEPSEIADTIVFCAENPVSTAQSFTPTLAKKNPKQERSMTNTILARRERVFLALAGVFLCAMTMLNILGITRFVQLGPWALAVGVLPYPLTFLCTDLISELLWKKRAIISSPLA